MKKIIYYLYVYSFDKKPLIFVLINAYKDRCKVAQKVIHLVILILTLLHDFIYDFAVVT
jgi:hypothetical protein